MRREPADRIRGGRIAREQQRLAATAAPIELLPSQRARPARLLHPVRPPKAREGVGLAPNPLERMLTHVGELEPWDRRRGLARQHISVRSDHHRRPAPAAHAWLRQLLIKVREHPQHLHLGTHTLAEALDRFLAAAELLPRWHQRVLVDGRPAVVLRVRKLEPLRPELEYEVEHLLDPIQVLPVQDAIDRQWETELLRQARGPDLLLERSVSGDSVVLLRVRALDRDLLVVEPS